MTEMKNNMKEATKEDFLEKTLASNKNATAQKCQLRICMEAGRFWNPAPGIHVSLKMQIWKRSQWKTKNRHKKETDK